MTIYAVLTPPDASPAAFTESDADHTLFIKDGFCWPALFIPMIWTLWHRLWLVFLGYLAIAVAIEGLSFALGGPAVGISAALFALLFAFEANNLRRWTMERRGWNFAGAIAAGDRDEAEVRFFAGYLDQPGTPAPGTIDQAEPRPRRATGLSPRVGGESVVGLTLGRNGS
ncbi:DUF2628 domain-containing protein [Rhizobiales bacterium]|uniref:DUF2628 domain-containing protein n=1 Tax=Hongsoonwoonella zoysiae TaxID=2821844 RepID=UPI001560C41F|nr:DUF2628 domain-containing protein [Hongsoonwoonella zoysiae]NRG16667.1 DUF2628 domain-containing protein [Hongsoonwoonella zoysiae]